MHEILGFNLQELGALTVLLTFVFSGCVGLIRYFRKSISEPMKASIDELREDLRESREKRERNEGKLFNITDDHTKSIIKLEGRVNNVEVATQSNTMRIDRITEKRGK